MYGKPSNNSIGKIYPSWVRIITVKTYSAIGGSIDVKNVVTN